MNKQLKTQIKSVLEMCGNYFDRFADADQPSDRDQPIPNEEMSLLTEVDTVLEKIEKEEN